MTPSVRISRKSALALLAYTSENLVSSATTRAHEELRRALEPKPKTSAKRKTEKRNRSKRKETSAIYEQVAKRAEGHCEAPTCALAFDVVDPPHMDHYLPKGQYRQSVRTCWLIHASCHGAKHAGSPTTEYWQREFILHARIWGYTAEANIVRGKLEAESILESIPAVGCP